MQKRNLCTSQSCRDFNAPGGSFKTRITIQKRGIKVNPIFRSIQNFLAIVCVMSLAACGGGGDSAAPSSGNSTSGAPLSFLGKTYVGNVTKNDGGPNVLAVGDTFTYTFIDANTIYGTGFVPVTTTSWDYTASGNRATVRLFFSAGRVVQQLTFLTPTSGTYHSDATLNSGTTGWHEGTFTLSDYTGGGGSSNPGTGGGGQSTTGQVAVWTSRSSGSSIAVSIDGSSVGSLTSYFTSAPTCGASGTITKTLPVGTHSLSATATGGSWGPANFNITAGGCLTYQLN